jgi:hypothetical protein
LALDFWLKIQNQNLDFLVGRFRYDCSYNVISNTEKMFVIDRAERAEPNAIVNE